MELVQTVYVWLNCVLFRFFILPYLVCLTPQEKLNKLNLIKLRI